MTSLHVICGLGPSPQSKILATPMHSMYHTALETLLFILASERCQVLAIFYVRLTLSRLMYQSTALPLELERISPRMPNFD